MTQLLVSVRSALEAVHALAGGADVIDVKEPRLGSLGRADDDVIASVVQCVAGRVPVSAALGELLEINAFPSLQGLSFVKYGLAGCRKVPHWPRLFANIAETYTKPAGKDCQLVHVAYVDWQCAQAPPLDDVVDLACRSPGNVLLLDTHCKSVSTLSLGRVPTLLDWLSFEEVLAVGERCRRCEVRVALAGSIGPAEMRMLLPARPTWFAVRGAACDGGRDGTVQEGRVRDLAQFLRSGHTVGGLD